MTNLSWTHHQSFRAQQAPGASAFLRAPAPAERSTNLLEDGGALRGAMFGALLSIPLWAVGIAALYQILN